MGGRGHELTSMVSLSQRNNNNNKPIGRNHKIFVKILALNVSCYYYIVLECAQL